MHNRLEAKINNVNSCILLFDLIFIIFTKLNFIMNIIYIFRYIFDSLYKKRIKDWFN